MSILISAGYIYSQPFGENVDNRLWVNGRRGTGTGASNNRAFGVDYPVGAGYNGSSKIMTGYGTYSGTNPTRINFQQSFQYYCSGLSVQFIDNQGVNWDSTIGRGTPTIVMLAGQFDASGFSLTNALYWNSTVTILPAGTWGYCYAAYGV